MTNSCLALNFSAGHRPKIGRPFCSAPLLPQIEGARNHMDFERSFFSARKISGIESFLKP
jgi:hypothetical protein